jgi:hypothetical protein
LCGALGKAGLLRVATLMKRMGIETLYCRRTLRSLRRRTRSTPICFENGPSPEPLGLGYVFHPGRLH